MGIVLAFLAAPKSLLPQVVVTLLSRGIAGRRAALVGLGFATIIAVSVGKVQLASAASPACPNGSTMAFVAHEDDSLLFLSPDLLHDIQATRCVRTVFVTAGDDGQGPGYWLSREDGAEAAYAEMAGVADTWTQSDAGVSGHPMPLMTLVGDPQVSLVFMRLPDGDVDGSGFASTGFESLQKLYQGTISEMTSVDGTSSYTKTGLTFALLSLMEAFTPDRIDTQDFAGTFGDGDHSDHHAVAYLTRDASRAYTTFTHTLVGYMDYLTQNEPANVSGTDLTDKSNAWYTYAADDADVCATPTACQGTDYGTWLARQYTVGSETGGPGVIYPPTANAGPNQSVTTGATVQLDGSGSVDPGGNPSYQWTQTSGPAVTLSSATAVKPTFTAPASAGTLTFQLVVSDGSLRSQPSTVTITVSGTAPPTANAGPNQSVTTGATVQLDGSGSVDPGGKPSYQWTQTGGYTVALSSATAVKPTFIAPTAGTYTFQLVVSDGSVSSQPSTVTITVTAPSNNLAPSATVTASSQNTSTGQLAVKAVDGVVDGYPGDYTREWATVGGGVGSWLNLGWASAQTIQTVVLYDRPNLNDQITAATLTFSNGSSVSVPALNNNGSATTVNLSSPVTTTSLLMTVNSVKATTQNIGLAEIQVFPPQTSGQTPTANAGPNQSVTTGATVQLDGSGSVDPGGNPSYQWTQTSGPAVTLSSATAVKPTFTAPASAGTLTFQLVVSDGSLRSQPSTVTITVSGTAPPTANAGPNQSVTTGATVQLDGSGSVDPGGNPSYQWTQTSGPAVTLSSATAVKPTFTAPASAGTLTFQLVVSDGSLRSQPSTVTITVSGTAPPTANAGPNQSVTTGATVQLDGSGSVDPGGNPSYQWTQTSGPAVTLSSATAVKPTFTAPASAGTLTFQLVVSDGSLRSQPSTVTITVSGTAPPTANAGPNQSVTTGATVQLDGSGSVDPGGKPSYQWTQTGGYTVALSSATAVKPTFIAPTAGTYTFQLVVSDGSVSSQPSTVTITVTAPSNNLAPSATVTASSQNTSTGQLAVKAVDGVVDGYPGDYTREWATVGGGVGSWLNLGWASAQTIQTVVLYDRPNLNDQITAATLTFSNGSSVSVPALNNNGSATTVNLSSPVTTTSLLMTVNSVKATTQNIGLAEIQVFPPQTSGQTPTANAGLDQLGAAGATAGALSANLRGSRSPRATTRRRPSHRRRGPTGHKPSTRKRARGRPGRTKSRAVRVVRPTACSSSTQRLSRQRCRPRPVSSG